METNPVNAATPAPPEGETVERWVADPKTDTYVKMRVPVSAVVEPEDRLNADALDTTGYDPNLNYFWANSNPDTHDSLRDKGYLPVRETVGGRHPLRETPGIPGKVVGYKDGRLFAMPRDFAERRRAREEARRIDEQRKRLFATDAELSEKLKGTGAEIREGGYGDFEARGGDGSRLRLENELGFGANPGLISGGGFDAQDSDALREANALETAQQYALNGPQVPPVPQRSTFGGYQGSPQYNQWQTTRDQQQQAVATRGAIRPSA